MRSTPITSLVVAAAILAACGGGSSTKTATPPSATASPLATEQATKAAPTAIPPSATAQPPTAAPPTDIPPSPPPEATSTPLPPPPPPPPPPPSGGSISIVAKDTLFTQASFTAAAGALTASLDNQDSGIIHNVHFFDAAGASVAETDLVPGPVTAAVTFNVTPGRYTFKCDVHPQAMHGVLTVS